MVTKLVRLMTYHNQLLLVNFHDCLTKWNCQVTWQLENVNSAFTEGLLTSYKAPVLKVISSFDYATTVSSLVKLKQL